MTPFAAWVLSLMVLLQPRAPWRETYAETATAIADAAAAAPLFEGDRGPRTAALLVSLSWFESRYDPDAIGDHGAAHGLFQVHGHGELADPAEATRVALEMLRASFRVCRARPLEDRLGWYAAGGDGCDRGLRESRNRVGLAQRLYREHPFVP